MDIGSPQPLVKQPDSRLVIHTDESCIGSSSRLGPVLRRLRSLYSQVLPGNKPLPIKILILDLQGVCVFSTDWAGPRVTVDLPGGGYHIKTRFGEIRKNYTLTIESGLATDLYLHWPSRLH